MSMKYPLDLLNDSDFEKLVISICQEILGIGTIGFTTGRDGGRDGIFSGKAHFFPSKSDPWNGKFIIQAKHTEKPYASCSDSDFTTIINDEIPKIKKLKEANEIDYYLIFTNRRLTGQKNADIKKNIVDETKIKDVFIFSDETIQSYLVRMPEIAKQNGLTQYLRPLEFYDEDICDVLRAFPDPDTISLELDREKKWAFIEKAEKNQLNKLSEDYFNDVLVEDIKYFDKIKTFLEDPANSSLKRKYNHTIYDIRNKIGTYNSQYETFEQIFDVLFEYIFNRNKNLLKENRPLIKIFLHYMYFTCDIGKKEKNESNRF